MQPWDAYLIYNAVRLHFDSEDYDVFKYNFKTSAKQKSFLLRKDRFFFAKLAKKYPDKQTLVDFLVANFTFREKGGCWAGDLIDPVAEDAYRSWLKKRDSMTYFFTQQIDTLALFCEQNKIYFDNLLKNGNQNMSPIIVKLHKEHTRELETIVIIDLLVNFMKNVKVSETIFWPDFSRKVRKYRPFLKQTVDLEKFKDIILKRFTSI